jgi:hypothetical protein
MKRSITNDQLWNINRDIQRMNKEFPAIAFFLGDKFFRFYNSKDNKFLMDVINKRISELQKKYVVHDSEDVAQRVEPGNEQSEWLFLESAIAPDGQLITGDQVKQAYYKEAGEFLSRSVDIQV